MDKLTITYEHGDGEETTFIKEGGIQSLSGTLEAMEAALRASGFSFDGYLTIEENDNE